MACRYNERFLHPDPLSKMAGSRKTRYRHLKRQKMSDASAKPPSSSTAEGMNEDPSQHNRHDSIDDFQLDSDESSDENSETLELLGDFFDIFPRQPETDFDFSDVFCDNDSNSGDEDQGAQAEPRNTQELIMEAGALQLFPQCPLSLTASTMLIKKYQMRHNLTEAALSDLLTLIKVHCPSPNVCPSSLYLFNKQLPVLRDPLDYSYFCNRCLQELPDKSTVICPNVACGIALTPEHISCFIELPLEPQLTTILQRNGVIDKIRKCRRGGNQGALHDICDGDVYQEKVCSGFLANVNNVSFQFNTDGVPVFRSSSFSFWPLHLIINELPHKMRIAKENRLLAGIWYGKAKPDMTLFLRPLAETLKKLHSEGVTVSLPCMREQFICRAVLLCASFDMPAKAQVLNMMQYNGRYGCSHCLQAGQTVKTGERGQVHAFPYIPDDPNGPARTDVLIRQHAQIAHESGSTECGIKGPTWLATVPEFNLSKGTVMDYMHCVLLVVSRLLLRLWFSSKYHKELWYIGSRVVEVDKRLCAIRPPNEIQRTPRSIAQTVKHWKAHELRAWLLHYSPVVLHGILLEEYYQHHLLLVEGVYLLLQDVVRESDLQQSSQLLKHYCFLMSTYYGERYMTSSVHGLMHLPTTVRNLGPLWCNSCFPFESANGDLLKLFHGTQAVEKQIPHHVSELQKMPTFAQTIFHVGSQEGDLYQKMSKSTRGTIDAIQTKISDEILLIGKSHIHPLTDDEKELFGAVLTPGVSVLLYSKVLLVKSNRIVTTNSKITLRDNSCIAYLKDGSRHIGIVHKIVQIPENGAFLIVYPLMPSPDKLCKDEVTNAEIDEHIVKLFPLSRDTKCIIQVSQIEDKVVVMDLIKYTNYVYASFLPNCKELD